AHLLFSPLGWRSCTFETSLYAVRLREYLIPGSLVLEHSLEPRVLQRKRESRQETQVGTNRRTNQREHDADRFPIKRAKIDRLVEEAQGDQRTDHMQHH